MTQFELGLEGIKLTLAFSALLFAYFVVYRRARLDAYRADLFVLRNELWMYMYERGLVDHPAHRKMRATLNSLIRAAPMTNLFVILPLLLRSPKKVEPTIGELIGRIGDPSIQGYLREIDERTSRKVFVHLFIATLPGCIFGIPVALYVFAKWCWDALRGKIRAQLNTHWKKTFMRFAMSTDALGRSRVPALTA